MGNIKTITLPWPDKTLSSNARVHWSKRADATKAARNAAWSVSMQSPRIGKHPDADLFIEYYPKTYRGDVQNVPHMLKAYIDGIADAMGCDDKAFKVHYPPVWAGKSNPGTVVFRIVPALVDVQVRGQIS